MSNVAYLIPNNSLCVDGEALADRLRAIADEIELGHHGAIERVCLVIEADGEVENLCIGRPTEAARLVGLLEWAKMRAIGALP